MFTYVSSYLGGFSWVRYWLNSNICCWTPTSVLANFLSDSLTIVIWIHSRRSVASTSYSSISSEFSLMRSITWCAIENTIWTCPNLLGTLNQTRKLHTVRYLPCQFCCHWLPLSSSSRNSDSKLQHMWSLISHQGSPHSHLKIKTEVLIKTYVYVDDQVKFVMPH